MKTSTVLLRGVLLPLVVFVVSLLGVIFLDRHLRLMDGDIRSGGIPGMLWFASHWACAAVPVGLLISTVRRLSSIWAKLAIVALTSGVGFVLYVYIGLTYITESGIDTL